MRNLFDKKCLLSKIWTIFRQYAETRDFCSSCLNRKICPARQTKSSKCTWWVQRRWSMDCMLECVFFVFICKHFFDLLYFLFYYPSRLSLPLKHFFTYSLYISFRHPKSLLWGLLALAVPRVCLLSRGSHDHKPQPVWGRRVASRKLEHVWTRKWNLTWSTPDGFICGCLGSFWVLWVVFVSKKCFLLCRRIQGFSHDTGMPRRWAATAAASWSFPERKRWRKKRLQTLDLPRPNSHQCGDCWAGGRSETYPSRMNE